LSTSLSSTGIFLHVGCGPKRIDQTPFSKLAWSEIRLDINPDVEPDLIGTMTDMANLEAESVDAVYSSHNIEHLYPDEVPIALAEFYRVLKPEGFLLLTCPDLQSICTLVVDDQLTEPAYTSAAGPISAIDMIFGHRASLQAGNRFMAHRCGFTAKVLTATLQAAGFQGVASMTRPAVYDLWALATKSVADEMFIRELASGLFPSS